MEKSLYPDDEDYGPFIYADDPRAGPLSWNDHYEDYIQIYCNDETNECIIWCRGKQVPNEIL